MSIIKLLACIQKQTIKLKTFDDTNIENPVKNARNLNDISQNNNLPLKNIIYLTQR